MRENMEHLGFDVGYGWWKLAPSQMQRLLNKQIHDFRSCIAACNVYQPDIHSLTYSSAPLTELIKNTNPWRWMDKVQAAFEELKNKVSSTNCLAMPALKGEIILMTETRHLGGGGYPSPVA